MKRPFVFWLTFLVACPLGSPAYADAVTNWNASAGKAAIAACISPADDPLHESRLYAMTHIAIHDALNAIDRRYGSYVFQGPAVPWASRDAAIAAAARDVLVAVINQIPAPFPPACIAAGISVVEADYKTALDAILDDDAAKTKGIEVGRAAAAAILLLRDEDGSDTLLVDSTYREGNQPGEYRFTPGFPFAFAPGWSNVSPFVLNRPAQFRPQLPFKLKSEKYSSDYEEVKLLGGDGVTTPHARTADQTEIALFWVESSPLQWNRIARAVSPTQGFDLWENARLFGLLNMALADGYISSWNGKYHYNFWRPVTAIRMADSDGNPDTVADPTWTPLRPTPPIPDHDSAHSVQGGAAAQVFRRVFGTDGMRFSACSLTLPAGSTCNDASPVIRHYSSFTQAEQENGLSRILVGFHFRRAVEEGIQHGNRIADRAVNLFMRPIR